MFVVVVGKLGCCVKLRNEEFLAGKTGSDMFVLFKPQGASQRVFLQAA
jgi:hypothetical protein